MKTQWWMGIGVAALLGGAQASLYAAPRTTAVTKTPVKEVVAPLKPTKTTTLKTTAPLSTPTSTSSLTSTKGAAEISPSKSLKSSATLTSPKTNTATVTESTPVTTTTKAPKAALTTPKSGNTGIVPPYIRDRIGHGGDQPRVQPMSKRLVFGGGRVRAGGRSILETVFNGEQGYDPSHAYQATLDHGTLVNSSQNRVALRNALINGSKLPAVSNPGGATVHHVLCHILAMKRIVEVPLPNGQKGSGVEYIADAGQGKYAAHLLYRNGEQLMDVPVDQAPAGTKHVAFLEGSSTGASIVPGKSMGDTWAFWDVIKNGYQAPLDTGAKINGTSVTESDALSSAIDGLMSMTTRDAQSRQLLQIAPRMRGQAPDSPGQYSHRQVLMNSIVSSGIVTREEALAPAFAQVIPADVEREMYKGAYDAGTRLNFVKAVEKLVQAEPPRANELTVYGFGRKADAFDTNFQRQ
jgi:hypothetical protein